MRLLMKKVLISGVLAIFSAGIVHAQTPPAGNPVLEKYCVGCHNDKAKTAGLSLANIDLAHPGNRAGQLEKVSLKLRAGMMPPPGMPRPDAATVKSVVATIEDAIDREAALRPNPGRP